MAGGWSITSRCESMEPWLSRVICSRFWWVSSWRSRQAWCSEAGDFLWSRLARAAGAVAGIPGWDPSGRGLTPGVPSCTGPPGAPWGRRCGRRAGARCCQARGGIYVYICVYAHGAPLCLREELLDHFVDVRHPRGFFDLAEGGLVRLDLLPLLLDEALDLGRLVLGRLLARLVERLVQHLSTQARARVGARARTGGGGRCGEVRAGMEVRVRAGEVVRPRRRGSRCSGARPGARPLPACVVARCGRGRWRGSASSAARRGSRAAPSRAACAPRSRASRTCSAPVVPPPWSGWRRAYITSQRRRDRRDRRGRRGRRASLQAAGSSSRGCGLSASGMVGLTEEAQEASWGTAEGGNNTLAVRACDMSSSCS